VPWNSSYVYTHGSQNFLLITLFFSLQVGLIVSNNGMDTKLGECMTQTSVHTFEELCGGEMFCIGSCLRYNSLRRCAGFETRLSLGS
jgi:hypothetical protein